MGKEFLKKTADLLQTKHKRKQWQKIMISLSLVVAMLTSILLIHPAITMERKVVCGQEEHTHSNGCYEKKLICGKEEHTKTDETDTAEEHTHTDACYEEVLTCSKQEHTHSEACYAKEEPATTEATTAVSEDTAKAADSSEEKKAEEPEQSTTEATNETTAAEATTEAAEQTTEEAKAEARTLTAKGKDYTVQVDCPKEAKIPAEAKLVVKEIKKNSDDYEKYYKKTEEAVAKGEDTEISFARFFDISFEVDGKEIEPAAKVEVKITYDDKVEVADTGKVKSVHFDDKGKTEVLNVKTNEKNGKMDEVKFDAKSFSVYAIVGTETSDSSTRLTVNFYNGATLFATMYVKKADLTIEEGDFSTIIYDPGVPDVGSDEVFKGWHIAGLNSTNGTYTTDTKAYTINSIRNYIREQITEINKNDELNIYAMIFKKFSITYLDDKNVSLGTDQILVTKDTSSTDYTINMAYSPSSSDQAFMGWNVTNGSDHINGYTEGQKYENGTVITITGDVTFSVNAPRGHWLIFDENGKGATYNAPQFVKSGDVTSQPTSTMTRNGYTFGGWYTDSSCTTGKEFSFGSELTNNTTIYAKWISNEKANYSIIIWKQNISGTGYDFEETIQLTGNVGAKIDTVVQSGTGNNSYAKINGTDYKYTGFHLNTFDQNVTIVTEGTALVNIYYDRTQYTLTFQKKTGGKWTTIKTITARYQENISSNFPIVGTDGVTYNQGQRWEPVNSNIYKYVLVYIDIMPAENTTFRLNTADYDEKTMSYYIEALPGESNTVKALNPIYDENNKDVSTNKDFVEYNKIVANYNYVTFEEDFINLIGFTRLGASKTINKGKYNISGKDEIKFYYTRDSYLINYMDGVYVDENGNPVSEEKSRGNLGTSSSILYNADISSYNSGGVNYFEPIYQGYVFEGWYSDDKCTKPYTFDKMPQGGITVYAKWRQVQYRVFLHPNADDDESLDWGADSQSMTSVVSYGDKVSTPTGLREEYEFVGWYLDEACTQVFNADAYILNDTTVTTPYNKTVDMTDPMDKWGNIGSNASNSDSEKFWITKKLDLYAKWRAKLVGADGINVIYDANGGTNAPTDSTLYLDGVQASAQEAATAPEVAEGETPKAFKYWVVQTWNEETGKYEDTDVTVYPGDVFTVLKENARQTANADNTADNPSYTYTVQLRAEYGDWDPSTKTAINWHSNTKDKDGNTITGAPANDIFRTDENLKINEAVDIASVPTNSCYEGYQFLGWSRRPNTNELWLEYDNGKYKLAGTDTEVKQVAADQLGDLPNDIYAIWEKKTFEVTVKKVVSGALDDSNAEFGFTYTLDDVQKIETFNLKNNAEKKINVPYDTVLALTESNATEFNMSASGIVTEVGSSTSKLLDISVNNYTATTRIKGNATITITNTRKQFVVDFKKTDKSGNVLTGATFNLKRRPLASTSSTTYVAYDPSSISFGNTNLALISGEYELIENSAPNGHVILTNHIYFTVAQNGTIIIQETKFSDGTIIAVLESGTSANSKGTITIRNEEGKALPNTGGSGTLPYTLGGLLLMFAAALMYGFKLRRRGRRLS